MKTSSAVTLPIPHYTLQLEEPVHDFDVRRLLVRGFALDNISPSCPLAIIILRQPPTTADPEGAIDGSWLAVSRPQQSVGVEYIMYGAHFPVEGAPQ